MNRIAYLAEPIDQSDHGAWRNAVTAVERIAVNKGYLVYRPSMAWSADADVPVGPEIEVVNRANLAISSILIAVLPEGVPSVGVPREIEAAKALGLPVLVLSAKAGWSLYDCEVLRMEQHEEIARWIANASAERNLHRQLPFVLEEGARLPVRTYDGDAGYDLFVHVSTAIEPGQFADIACGARVALPPGIWGRITGRSSTLRHRSLLIAEGIIDSGYRGDLFAGVFNLSAEPVKVEAGERLAQLILHENTTVRFTPVSIPQREFERIPNDGRGESGFGSTGA